MKNYLVYMLAALGCSSLLMTSCIEEDLGVGNIQQQVQSNGEWNKNKTFEIHYLSGLKDEGIFNNEAATNYIKNLGDACSLSVIDRVDIVSTSYNTNYATDIAFNTSRFSSYALNKIKAGWRNTFQGSLILFNHKINFEEGFKVTKDCFVKYIPINVKSIAENPIDMLIPFSTVRFESKEQIDAAASVFATVFDNQHGAIMVGTVNKNHVEDLKKAAEKINGCTFTEVLKNQDTDYQLFMIGDKSWVLREVRSTNVSSELNDYQISIEAGVQ